MLSQITADTHDESENSVSLLDALDDLELAPSMPAFDDFEGGILPPLNVSRTELKGLRTPQTLQRPEEGSQILGDVEFTLSRVCAHEVLSPERELHLTVQYRLAVVRSLISFLEDDPFAPPLQPLIRDARKQSHGLLDEEIVHGNIDFLKRTERLLSMLPFVSVRQNDPKDFRDYLAENTTIHAAVCGPDVLFDQAKLVSAFIQVVAKESPLSSILDLDSEYNTLFSANARLVVSRAKRFRGRGVPFRDLISAGMEGLSKAIDRNRPELGSKFSTYAVHWIEQGCQSEVAENGNLIRIPRHVFDAIPHIRKVQRTHEEALEAMPPRLQEAWIANELDLTVDTVQRANVVLRSRVVSVDEPRGEEDQSMGFDGFPETVDRKEPHDIVGRDDLVAKVQQVAQEVLSDHEIELLRLSGILSHSDGSHEALPFKEIAELFGYSRGKLDNRVKRAQKILSLALEKELSVNSL